MKKSNFFKRFMAGLLATLFVVTMLPQTAFANPQSPVEQLTITSITRTPGTNAYHLALSWLSPPPALPGTGTTPGAPTPTNPGMPGPPPAGVIHPVEEFHVMRFDAGAAAATNGWANWIPQVTHPAMPPFIQNRNLTQTLQPGNFYAFQIRARHFHNYFSATAPGYSTATAVDSVGSVDNAIFVMPDINVEAYGHGRSLTVHWTQPQLAGSDPFTHYRILATPNFGGTPIDLTIPVTHPDLVVSGGVYTFVFPDLAQLIPGSVYTVRVEPILNNISREVNGGIGLTNAFPFDLYYTDNLFQDTSAFIRAILGGTPIGNDHLLLHWATLRVQDTNAIVRIRQEMPDGTTPIIAEFRHPAIEVINHLLIDRPPDGTRFILSVYLGNPPERVEPDEEWTFYADLHQWQPTRPNIVNIETAPSAPLGMDITWDAFMRAPFNDAEAAQSVMHGTPPRQLFRDPDIVYDVWITDNAQAFAGLGPGQRPAIPPVTPYPAGLTQAEIGAHRIGFDWDRFHPEHPFTNTFTFTQYVRASDGIQVPLIQNQVYYIRIVARRIGDGVSEDVRNSVAAYGSYFIFGDAMTPPAVLPRPPLRVDEERANEIDLAWENRWLEAFELITDPTDPNFPGRWHSAFGVLNGNLVFDDEAVGPDRFTPREGVQILHVGHPTSPGYTLAQMIPVLQSANGGVPVPVRMQHLPHPQTTYEFHWVPLSEIASDLEDDIEAFVAALHATPGAWTALPVEVIHEEGLGGNLTLTLLSTIEGLEPDTTYAIFIRPRISNMDAWWPTLIMGTTTNDRGDMDITPPAPFLSPYQEGDRWLEFTLRPFISDGSINYEFWISEFNDIDTAWEFVPESSREPAGINANQLRIFRAGNLFPETTYYIWVRAAAANNDERYNWSASITMSTLPLGTPPPPRGLGLAGPNEVNIVNLQNETQYSRVAHDHMVVAWSPIRGYERPAEGFVMPDDVHLPLEGNVAGAMGTTIMGSPMIDFSYMVLFPDLLPNTAYWVRALTILSVHRDGIGGEITERVDFIVQMATNPQFLDATTVYVMPDASAIQHGLHTRMTISEWAGPMMFWTTRDDGEFDGDVIPELFPLPDRDFEINYNPYTRTLTWRFRSNDIDEDGHRDNLVDQRFISRLVQLRTFEHVIDMTHYNNQPVENRIVELPYTIITAFEQRGIDFGIIAGATTYTFSPGFADTPQNVGFGLPSRLRMYITNETAPASLTPNRQYLTTPQTLGINVVNRSAHTNIGLTTLAAPVRATHNINRAAAMDYHIGAYVMDGGDVAWRRNGSGFNEFASTVYTSTTRPTTFAAIGTEIPQLYNATPEARDAMYFVNTQINFTDMDWFAPNFAVDVWQLNRVIHAIARGVTHAPINMLDNLTEQEMSSLANARMLVPGHYTVAREDAIAALVRLFEVRTGSRITGAPTLQTSSFPDIATASPHLQQALLNAEALGFLGFTTNTANPHGEMTWGETMLILEIILRN